MNPFGRFAGVSGNVQGMMLMLSATAFTSGMHAFVKLLALGMHPFEIYFLRQTAGLIILVPWFMRIGFGALKTKRPYLHVTRGACNAASGMAWFLALSMLPLAKATALNMSAGLFAVIGAALFLGERGEWRRWAVLLFGFAGVLVIVRPGFELIGLGVVLVLGSRVFTAAQKILAKKLSATERTPTIVAYTALTMSILTIIPALNVWQTPRLEQLGWIAIMAFFGTFGQMAMVQAYKLGDISAVEPMSFTRILWAGLYGFVFFSEVPSLWTWAGAAMIIAAVFYLAHAESRAHRSSRNSL